jgi:hypothetical protein
LNDFLAQDGTEAQCADALFGRRRPQGFAAVRTRDLMQYRHSAARPH